MGLDLSKTTLGIELGSTRIKAVLIDENFRVIADGEHYWESTFENQIWTYALDEMWDGLQNAYKDLKEGVLLKYNIPLTTVGGMLYLSSTPSLRSLKAFCKIGRAHV